MKHLFVSILILVSFHAFSQDKSSVVFQMDFMNRHYWRGTVFGNAPVIEPQVTMQFDRFSFNIWAAYAMNDSYSEIDLIPRYTLGNYDMLFLDYYNPVPHAENRFFDFSREFNRHSGELMVAYNGTGFLPVRWMAGTFIYGDRHPETGRSMLSTYVEMGYPFMITGANAEISAGISPWEGYYTKSFAVVHTAFTIEDEITIAPDAWLPLRLSLTANPSSNEAWVILSLGIIKVRKPNR